MKIRHLPHKDAATISLASVKAKDLQQLHHIVAGVDNHLIAGATERHLTCTQAFARSRCSNSPFTRVGRALPIRELDDPPVREDGTRPYTRQGSYH